MAGETSQRSRQHPVPGGTHSFPSSSHRRCCAWAMVGVGAVLLLVGVVLFVLGVVPGSMAGDVVKWLGAVCGVLGIVLLVASVAVYITASRTKDTENYSVTKEESTVSKSCRIDRPRSIIREPSLKPRGGCVKATPGGYTSFLYSSNYKGEEPTGD